MRKIAMVSCVLVCSFPFTAALAQNCRPDVSREDKITKDQIEIWVQPLFSTGLGASFMSTSELSVKATIGRYGAVNAINIEIQKKEDSATNAAFESAVRAARGKKFYFGFKSGAPVAFVVTDVGNNAKVEQGLLGAKGVTTAVLSAAVQDNDLAALRDALTSRQVDGVRIDLAGDDRIEKSVDDKNGRKLMEKFSCFYQALDAKGIVLSKAANHRSEPMQPASVSDGIAQWAFVQGRYLPKNNDGSFLELSSDGLISVQQNGKVYLGRYQVAGETLTTGDMRNVADPHWKVKATTARVVGGTITWANGDVYEKQTAPQKSTAAPLTVDQVVQMVAAKLPDDIIIKAIQKSSSKFDLAPEELIKLKAASVSDAVMRAMQE